MNKLIPQFTGIDKSQPARNLKDDKGSDSQNTLFKDGKVKRRFGYEQLGDQLSGTVLALNEFSLLREDSSTLLAITSQATYEYDTSWTQFQASYNTGTAGQIGSEQEFNATTPTDIDSCWLDDTHIAIAYRDSDTNGKAIVGVLTGTTITFGTESTFNAADTMYISITAIDSTHIVVGYQNVGNTYGYAKVGAVSGTTISSWGSASAFNSEATTLIHITEIDDTHVLVSYADSSDYGRAKIGTISGTTISGWGSEATFYSGAISNNVLVKISSSVVAIYFSVVIQSYGILGSISGTTITFGSSSAAYSGITASDHYLSIDCIDSTHFVISFRNTSGYGYVKIATFSGTTISDWSSNYNFDYIVTYNSVVALDTDRIAVSYTDSSDSSYGKFLILEITDYEVTDAGSEYTFNAANTTYMNLITTDYYTVVAYVDQAGSKGNSFVYLTKSVEGSGTTWGTSWPESTYEIKFGTDDVEGTGTPDTWFTIYSVESTTFLTLEDYVYQSELLANGTDYVIRQSFLSGGTDYFDTCNIIEGLGGGDEKQVIFTNGVDPIKYFDGTTLGTLDMTGDGGTAPISLAKYCAYYHDHLMFAYCYDDPNWMPQTIYWSVRGEPTYWDSSQDGSAGYADLTQGDDKITGLEVYKQRLYVFKEDSIVECYYTGSINPSFEFTQDKIKGIGAPNGRTIINIGEAIIFKGRDNIYTFNGFQTNPVGAEIIDDLTDNEDLDYYTGAFASWLRNENLYCLHIVSNGSTVPDMIYVWNYLTNSWTIWEFAHNMTCFAIYGNGIVYGDNNGYVYNIDYTADDDNGTDIDSYFETKDFEVIDNGIKFQIRLLETLMKLDDNTGDIQISCSVDMGDNYSTAVVVDQDTDNSIYEHIQNWMLRGKTVRFKIENVDGADFAVENLGFKFEPAGSARRF